MDPRRRNRLILGFVLTVLLCCVTSTATIVISSVLIR